MRPPAFAIQCRITLPSIHFARLCRAHIPRIPGLSRFQDDGEAPPFSGHFGNANAVGVAKVGWEPNSCILAHEWIGCPARSASLRTTKHWWIRFAPPENAPRAVHLIGPRQQTDYEPAQQISNRIALIHGTVDVHVRQLFSCPTLFLDVNQSRALSVGLMQEQVVQNLLLTLSYNFQGTPSFRVNPVNGFEYNVAVQVPQYQIDSMHTLNNIPIASPSTAAPQVLGNLAQVNVGAEPASITHYNNRPMIESMPRWKAAISVV